MPMSPPLDTPSSPRVEIYDSSHEQMDGYVYPETMTARPMLLVRGQTSGEDRLIEIKGEVTIGRGSEATIKLDVDSVSRLHARLTVRADGWVEVADLSSCNGTYINGCSIVRGVLRPRDELKLGSFRMEVVYEGLLLRSWFDLAPGAWPRDGLTGALKRQAFLEALHGPIAEAQRTGQPLSLIMFDLDHLKRVNDTHGHVAGDEALRQVAALTRALYPDHMLSRYGGEEFALALPSTSREEAAEQAERLRQAVAAWQGEGPGGAPLSITISLGVATFQPVDGLLFMHIRRLIERADECLYRAKRAGRNRVEVG